MYQNKYEYHGCSRRWKRISVILCPNLSIEETQGASPVEGHPLYKTPGKYISSSYSRRLDGSGYPKLSDDSKSILELDIDLESCTSLSLFCQLGGARS